MRIELLQPSTNSVNPHDLELERAVLGQLFLPGVAEMFVRAGLSAADFYRDAHARIFAAVAHLVGQRIAPDILTVRAALLESGDMTLVTPQTYNEVCREQPRPAFENVRQSVAIMRRLAFMRELASAADRMSAGIRAGGPVNPEAVLAEHHRVVTAAVARYANDAERLFTPADELLATGPQEVPWVARPYVAAGAITELTGQVKAAGKTTLMLYMSRCIVRGESFLGAPTLQGAVVYLTEEHEITFRDALRRQGLSHGDLRVMFYGSVMSRSWPEIMGKAVTEAERVGARLIVVDTLGQFGRLHGDAENNAGDALKVTEPMRLATTHGIGIVSVRHERKSGGDVGQAGRGSTAFAGAADVLMSLRPEGPARENVRVIEARSRFGETPRLLTVEWMVDSDAPSNGSAAESTFAIVETSRTQALEGAVLRCMGRRSSDAMTVDEIVGRCGRTTGKTAVRECLASLLSSGAVEATGTGARNSPRRYWKASR